MSVFFARARTRRMTSLARLPSSIIHSTERHAASRSGVSRRSQRRQASALATPVETGWLSSWALEAVRSRRVAVVHVDDKGAPFVRLPLEKRACDQNRHATAVFTKVLFLARLEGSNRL